MGTEWTELTEAQKDTYKGKERTDRARYEKENAKYLAENPKQVSARSKKSSKSKGKAKDEGGPKKCTSAFFFYQADRREKLKGEKPELNHKQIVAVRFIPDHFVGAWKRVARPHRRSEAGIY